MHILFVNPRLRRNRSEASIWAKRLIEDLRSTPATVTALPDYSDNGDSAPAVTNKLGDKMKQATVQHLPEALISLLIEFKLFSRALRSMVWCSWMAWRRRKDLLPDVLYARAFEYDWSPWLVASILKCPMVLEVHSLFYLERRFRGRRESKLIKRLDYGLWQRAALIRVVSKPVAKLLVDESIDPERVRFIPYGIGVEAPIDRPSPSPSEPIQIVFVGSFYPWHGIETLVAAFAMTRPREANLRLCLIGDGLLRSACQQRARELRIDEFIEFTGWLPRAEVVQCLKKADIAVAPFLKIEPFYFDPVKVLEYMASGLPIIATDIQRIVEILDFGRAGMIVPPGDAEALAEAMLALARDAPLRLRLGKAGRDMIENGSSRQDIAQDVMALCGEAAAKNLRNEYKRRKRQEA